MAFEYTGFVNPYAASIGEQIAHSGDAAARAAEVVAHASARAAEIRGNAWAGAAQRIGNIPAEIAQARDASLNRQLKEQELGLRNQALQESVAEHAEKNRQRVVTTIGRMAGTSSTPDAFASGVDAQVQNGALPPAVGAHIKQQLQEAGPDGWRGLKQQYIDFADQYQATTKLGKDENIVRPSVGGGASVVASGPKGAPTEAELAMQATGGDAGAAMNLLKPKPNPNEASLALDAAGGDASTALTMLRQPKPETPDEIALKQARVREINAKLNGTVPMSEKDRAELGLQRDHLRAQISHWENADSQLDQAPTLTPAALDLTAKNFAMTGNLPPMGMGKTGAKVRTDIINRAADLYQGLDLASQKAAYDSNKKSLGALQQNADAVGAFEQTARKNIDLFLEQAKKVPDTGIPLLNTPARWASGQALGGKDVPGYEAARRSAISEVAKVISSPGLSGQLSDSARHEVESFIPQNATLGQAVRVMNVLKAEMENRSKSYADQIKAIQTRIATPPGGSAPSSSSSSAGGMIEAVDADGNVHHAPAGTPLPAGWKLK